MTTPIHRIARTALLAPLVAGCLAGLVGCSSVPQDEYDQALAENAELRDRLAETRKRLAELHAKRSTMDVNGPGWVVGVEGRAGATPE